MMSVVGLVGRLLNILQGVVFDVGRNKRKRCDNIGGEKYGSEKGENKRKKLAIDFYHTLASKDRINSVLRLFEDDKITSIGIYGMGGIGKTMLAAELFNQSPHVEIAWVSIGTQFTVYKLQQKIAREFGIDLSNDNDVNRRSALLYASLSTKHNCIIFLDDVWEEFRRENVGIPKHCKLVLTCRSLDVCRVMRCHKVIKVNPLPPGEAWKLFCRNWGCDVLISEEITRIAKDMCRHCAGVPLAINALALSMTGVYQESDWTEALQSLNRIPSWLDDTFTVLKRSYDNLSSTKLQDCFLLCALYPKGSEMSRDELIRLWIAVELIDEKLSSQVQYDLGHSILNKLVNSCLLEDLKDNRSLKMNSLVRDLALSLSGGRFLVKCGISSKELPALMECAEDVHAASIVLSTSPKFSNLSAFTMQHNPRAVVPDSAFMRMPSLRFLDLSYTPIRRLPDCISTLEELRVLDLTYCQNLKQLPSLAYQRKLLFLSLSYTSIEHIPCNLENLTMLADLNLSFVPQMEKPPRGVLLALSQLRRLSCDVAVINCKLESLASLEVLEARFAKLGDLTTYVRSQHWQSLVSFHLQVGRNLGIERPFCRRVSLHQCSFTNQEEDSVELPDNLQELYVDDCNGFRSLSDILNPTNASICSESTTNRVTSCKGGRGSGQQESAAFSSMQKCSIRRCRDIESLFAKGCLLRLKHLELIEVEDCPNLKELTVPEGKGYQCVIYLPELKRMS